MWPSSLLKFLLPRSRRRRKAPPGRRIPVLRLEALEDRTVLSTLTVTTAADAGPGSLRATIAAAAPGDTVVFAHGLAGQTIALTSGELAINHDLNIAGLGAKNLTV